MVLSFEVFVVVAALGAAAASQLNSLRTGLVGLFAVAMYLFIQACQTFMYLQVLGSRYVTKSAGVVCSLATNNHWSFRANCRPPRTTCPASP